MISGGLAPAALLLIDAVEGVREQSKEVRVSAVPVGRDAQFAVVVNKMDLVGYRQDVLTASKRNIGSFWGGSGPCRSR